MSTRRQSIHAHQLGCKLWGQQHTSDMDIVLKVCQQQLPGVALPCSIGRSCLGTPLCWWAQSCGEGELAPRCWCVLESECGSYGGGMLLAARCCTLPCVIVYCAALLWPAPRCHGLPCSKALPHAVVRCPTLLITAHRAVIAYPVQAQPALHCSTRHALLYTVMRWRALPFAIAGCPALSSPALAVRHSPALSRTAPRCCAPVRAVVAFSVLA